MRGVADWRHTLLIIGGRKPLPPNAEKGLLGTGANGGSETTQASPHDIPYYPAGWQRFTDSAKSVSISNAMYFL